MMADRPRMARLSDVDWTTWVPQDCATLLFVIRDDQVLCIRKKRALGARKSTAPAAKLDPVFGGQI